MIQIRHNVFETNSSSVHSMVICTYREYIDFRAGKVFYVDSNLLEKKFVTWDELLDILKNRSITISSNTYENVIRLHDNEEDEELEAYLKDWGIYTFGSYNDNEYESFHRDYTSPSGDHICVFGYYGESY